MWKFEVCFYSNGLLIVNCQFGQLMWKLEVCFTQMVCDKELPAVAVTTTQLQALNLSLWENVFCLYNVCLNVM